MDNFKSPTLDSDVNFSGQTKNNSKLKFIIRGFSCIEMFNKPCRSHLKSFGENWIFSQTNTMYRICHRYAKQFLWKGAKVGRQWYFLWKPISRWWRGHVIKKNYAQLEADYGAARI